jgi:hypothetical protein
MKLKLRLGIVAGIVLAVIAGISFYRMPMLGDAIAKSSEAGTIVPNTNGKARVYVNGVYKVEPENFSLSPQLRDLPPASESGGSAAPVMRFEEEREKQREARLEKDHKAKGLPPPTEEQKEDSEINERNVERVKRVVPGAGLADKDFDDPLTAKGLHRNAPTTMPTPSLTFNGATSADNTSAGVGSLTPPDTNGDVGPNHYVSIVNSVLKVFDKTGAVVSGPTAVNALWSSLPSTDPCRTRNDGDPVVVYDSLADRWVITQFAVPSNPNNYECIAVSKTADPSGAYFVWSYLYPGGIFNDYPKLAVWPDAYHLTFNQFNNAGTSFLGMGFLSQDRPKALAGDPTTSVVYTNVATIDANAGGGLPMDVDGLVPPPAGMAEVIGEFRSVSLGNTFDGIRFYKWVPDFITPANSTVTVLPDVAMTAFDARSPSSTSAVIEQPSPGVNLDGLNDRLMHRLAYRNLGSYSSPVNSIVGSFTVNVSGVNPTTPATYQAGVKWFEMRRTNDAFSVFDQGTHNLSPSNGSTGINNWMPSIAQDNQGSIAVGFSQSSTTQNANIMLAGRTNNVQNSGILNEGESLMYAAGGVQTSTGNRWGDYSAMTVDPVDDCTFWFTQEYYAATSKNGWSTRVGKFKYPGCTAVQKGTISGTITSCSTGLPVDQASVNATGGFERLTIANGTYSMSVTPGSYTVGASRPDGFTSSTVNTTVSNGQTSTVDLCMVGVAVLAPGSTSIVSESCGVANGGPDPGEILTVALPISNTGSANTSNLVATLQATGGVIDPGTAQNYGAVGAGSGSVVKNFTFKVDPSLTCGNSITLTWNLQDGAKNYGTVTRTYSSGSPVVSFSENFDNVTAPALPSGWTQNQTTGTGISWVTDPTTPSSAPNAAFANEPSAVNAAALESPSFTVTVPNALLTFKKSYTTESGFDGAVLEIKIGSGSWTDIITAGGSFIDGGYTGTISSSFDSPIAGREAWSGTSAGYTTTHVTLPATANGQSVQLRWLMASDSSVGSSGFMIDDVSVSAGVSCAVCTATSKTAFDFDGDGKTDVSVFRPSSNNWFLDRSTAGFAAYSFGTAGDILTPADFTGDGKTDIAVFRPSAGSWFVLRSEDSTFYGVGFGMSGDIPAPADYDGDGKADPAVFRPSSGTWFLQQSTAGFAAVAFGSSGDQPSIGDFDGDGKADIAVYRPTNGSWYRLNSSNGSFTEIQFGASGDKIVPADYTGDGKTDIAVWRGSTGTWYILKSEDLTFYGVQFGSSGDLPAPGDYDGDGKADTVVFRPADGNWYMLRSTAGFNAEHFGTSEDKPAPGAFVF